MKPQLSVVWVLGPLRIERSRFDFTGIESDPVIPLFIFGDTTPPLQQEAQNLRRKGTPHNVNHTRGQIATPSQEETQTAPPSWIENLAQPTWCEWFSPLARTLACSVRFCLRPGLPDPRSQVSCSVLGSVRGREDLNIFLNGSFDLKLDLWSVRDTLRH